MRWSFRLCRVFGIEIRLHWIFVLLVAWFGYEAWLAAGWQAGVSIVVTVLLVFLFVTLHELGHSLVARMHGVRVQDITLLPIGGMSRLSHIPEDPNVELKISFSGPAVNLAIAALLLPLLFIAVILHYMSASPLTSPLSSRSLTAADIMVKLIQINVILAVFNFMPAFPMDGGRILRALLAKFFPFVTATRIAARAGRAIALGFVVGGFLVNYRWMLGQPLLIIIAFFIYMASWQEEKMVEYQHRRPRPISPEDEPEEGEEPPPEKDLDETARAFVALARKLDHITGRNQLGR